MATLGGARLNDTIAGAAPGEHHGHYYCGPYGGQPCHPGGNPLTGIIKQSSGSVFINGRGVARVQDATQESDPCGPGTGKIAQGSSTVFCNGKAVSRLTDKIAPHHGYATITSASGNVFVG